MTGERESELDIFKRALRVQRAIMEEQEQKARDDEKKPPPLSWQDHVATGRRYRSRTADW